MKTAEHERQDWTVVIIIVAIGFLSVIVAGQLALRFSPRWQLNTNMESHLDPNSAYLTRRPSGFIEPVDPAILTQPGWIDEFLTPGVSIITGTPFPTLRATSTASTALPTTVSPLATNTPVIAASSTNTFVFIPSTATSTSKPKSTKTSPPPTGTTYTPTFTFNPSPTSPVLTSTATQTPTFTATVITISPTSTFTATATATRTPVIIPTDPTPPEIGTTPDGNVYDLPAGGTLTLGINLVANGDSSYDLAYYERAAGAGIFLDWVVVEIGDGTTWYTVFYWGDEMADTNSNMNFNILSNPQTPQETDQREILASELYNGSGIAIDIDAIVPPGTYPYIRFSAPAGDADNQTEIDAIEVLP